VSARRAPKGDEMGRTLHGRDPGRISAAITDRCGGAVNAPILPQNEVASDLSR